MNPKYQKVCAEIAKTEKKIEDLQAQLKELYDRKTEMENLEIINTVCAMVMDKDQIMSVYGSQEGATHIGFAICNPGDIVLAPNPGYPIFEMGPMLSGAKIVHYDLLPENGFLPDLEAIDPEVARAAKMM